MKKFTAYTRKQMSLSAKARCNDLWRKHQSESKRTKIDDDLLRKLYVGGLTQKEVANEMGITRKVVENAMRRLSITPRRQIKRDQWGSKNKMWKGEKAGVVVKHRRLYRRFGQEKKCSVCGTSDPRKSYDWANLSGNYDDFNDFKRMCRSCHWKYDGKGMHLKSHGQMRVPGEGHHNAKLTNQQIRGIRFSSADQKTISRKYGISQSNVSLIRRGLAWRHVK